VNDKLVPVFVDRKMK